MAALGALSAGLLHELNNPATAVQRGAARLEPCCREDGGRDDPLQRLVGAVPVPDDPLVRADAEGASPTRSPAPGVDGRLGRPRRELVRLGIDPAALAAALAGLPADQRGPAVRDCPRSAEIGALLDEVSAGADYLSKIVSGVRPLAYAADQSLTDVDLHAGLEQSLVLLRHKVPARRARRPRLRPAAAAPCRAGPPTWRWSGPTCSTTPWPRSDRRAP